MQERIMSESTEVGIYTAIIGTLSGLGFLLLQELLTGMKSYDIIFSHTISSLVSAGVILTEYNRRKEGNNE